MSEDVKLATSLLSDEVRLMVGCHHPAISLGALSYAIAAIAAEHAGSIEQFDLAVDCAVTIMKQQARRFGVGTVHP